LPYNRVLRGQLLGSDSLSRCSLPARWLFVGLVLTCDAYGRLDGRIRTIRAGCFPEDPFTDEQVTAWLQELLTCDGRRGGPVQSYQHEGRPYLALVRWEEYRGKSKRPEASLYPAPPLPEPAEQLELLSRRQQAELRARELFGPQFDVLEGNRLTDSRGGEKAGRTATKRPKAPAP
jgi:hypothetical protein